MEGQEAPDLPRYLLDLPRRNPATLMGRLRRFGFQEGPRRDAGIIYEASRAIGPFRLTIAHEGYESTTARDMDDIGIENVTISQSGEPMELDEVPGHILSEALREVQRLVEEA